MSPGRGTESCLEGMLAKAGVAKRQLVCSLSGLSEVESSAVPDGGCQERMKARGGWQDSTLMGREAAWNKAQGQDDGPSTSALRPGYFPSVAPFSVPFCLPCGTLCGVFLDAWEPVDLEDSHHVGENSQELSSCQARPCSQSSWENPDLNRPLL